MDLEVYDERRTAMVKLLEVAAGRAPFAEWAKYAEAMAPRKTEKLDALLNILYVLLEDVLLLSEGAGEIRNADIRRELEALASRVSFRWIRAAVHRADELSTTGAAQYPKEHRAGRAGGGIAWLIERCNLSAGANVCSCMDRFLAEALAVWFNVFS